MNIPASNVIGNGNITLYAGGTGGYGTTGAMADPTIGVCVGIANIMQISGKIDVKNFKGAWNKRSASAIDDAGKRSVSDFSAAP
jgi:hypothetical protein